MLGGRCSQSGWWLQSRIIAPVALTIGASIEVSMSASEIDVYVGLRMRVRREFLEITQSRLGRHLGLSFSQVQKYEKGTNRISAGRLYKVGEILGVPPGYFFEGLERSDLSAALTGDLARDFVSLSDAFAAIRDVDTRASLLALVRSLAGDPDIR